AADEARLAFRKALAAEFGERLTTAMKGGHLPDQDVATAAPALLGALIEGLVGPLAAPVNEATMRDAVQAITLFALRAVGVADARACGAGADAGAEQRMNESQATARIEALEVRIAHQDRTIEDLNTMVTNQWSRIESLTKQIERMADRLQRVEDRSPSDGPDPPPPHY